MLDSMFGGGSSDCSSSSSSSSSSSTAAIEKLNQEYNLEMKYKRNKYFAQLEDCSSSDSDSSSSGGMSTDEKEKGLKMIDVEQDFVNTQLNNVLANPDLVQTGEINCNTSTQQNIDI